MIKNKVLERKVDNFEDLLYLLEFLKYDFYFRGMANSEWEIKTSLERVLEIKFLLAKEENIQSKRHFQSPYIEMVFQQIFRIENADFYKNVLKINPELYTDDVMLKTQVLCQHQGCPTRLTDWTTEYLISLYFCLEDNTEKGDIAVWCIKKNALPMLKDALKRESYIVENIPRVSGTSVPNYYHNLKTGLYLIDEPIFNRIKAQKGVLIGCGSSEKISYMEQLQTCEWLNKGDVIKIIIDKSLRNDIRQLLKEKNLCHEYLYPKEMKDFNDISGKSTVDCLIKYSLAFDIW